MPEPFTITGVMSTPVRADLQRVPPSDGQVILILGRDDVRDGLGGLYVWDEDEEGEIDGDYRIASDHTDVGRWVRTVVRSAVGDLAGQRAAATTMAATSTDPTAIGTRSLASLAATRDNDQSEAFAALMDLLGVTSQQLLDRITSRRQSTPPPVGAPSADDVVMSATVRFDAATVFGQIVGYIQAGVGDPPG